MSSRAGASVDNTYLEGYSFGNILAGEGNLDVAYATASYNNTSGRIQAGRPVGYAVGHAKHARRPARCLKLLINHELAAGVTL